jgi:hypothetical protein
MLHAGIAVWLPQGIEKSLLGEGQVQLFYAETVVLRL